MFASHSSSVFSESEEFFFIRNSGFSKFENRDARFFAVKMGGFFCTETLFCVQNTVQKEKPLTKRDSVIGLAGQRLDSSVSMTKFRALMPLSCLHLGQNRGNVFSSVFRNICKRVFAPHIGHRTHCFCPVAFAVMFHLSFPSLSVMVMQVFVKRISAF